MSTNSTHPNWWCRSNPLTQSTFFMTVGLGTIPYLPIHTGILGNAQHIFQHTPLMPTLTTLGLASHLRNRLAPLPRDLLSSLLNIKHCVAIRPAAAGYWCESIARSMHTVPVKSRLVGKEAMHLTSIVVAIHGCSPLVDTMG